jgi:RNA polymerase sigma-70 factor (ECF subfamily)
MPEETTVPLHLSGLSPPLQGDVADAPEGAETRPELGRVFEEQAPKLWRAVFAFTGDREVTSDAVAEAFAQMLERGQAVRSPERWVWRAAFRIAAGELKARSRRAPSVPEGSYEELMSTSDLLPALAKVSPKQRAALILHYYADLPVREIARALGSSSGTVRVHLSQGRKRLRKLLEETDVGPA